MPYLHHNNILVTVYIVIMKERKRCLSLMLLRLLLQIIRLDIAVRDILLLQNLESYYNLGLVVHLHSQ